MIASQGLPKAITVDDGAVDKSLAKQHAQTIHDKPGDLDTIANILCQCSPSHNKAVAAAYEMEYNVSLAKVTAALVHS